MTVAPGNLGLGPSCGLHVEAESIRVYASFLLMSQSCGALHFPNCCIYFPLKMWYAGGNWSWNCIAKAETTLVITNVMCLICLCLHIKHTVNKAVRATYWFIYFKIHSMLEWFTWLRLQNVLFVHFQMYSRMTVLFQSCCFHIVKIHNVLKSLSGEHLTGTCKHVHFFLNFISTWSHDAQNQQSAM